MMNRNELLEKIAQIVLENPELKESMEMLMGGLGQTEEAVTQKPDMMYVLACRVKVHSEDVEEHYHYHPIVGETLLMPGGECNKIVSSSDLLSLQNSTRAMCQYYGSGQYQILAMRPEEFEKLQHALDETVTALMDNIHQAVEAVLKNSGYVAQRAISFEDIYRYILRSVMLGAHGVIGAALGSDSQIIPDISGVQYEYSEPSCGDEDELDEDEDDEDNDYDDEDEDDGPTREIYIIREV